MYRSYRCLFGLLLIWVDRLFVGVTVHAETTSVNTDSESNNDVQDKYLYHIEEAKGIIIDYEPPVPATNNGDAKNDDPNLHRPDFIYGPNQGPRVVEFYAPWCPHCQHFRSHYIKFAQQVNAIMKEYGVSGPPIQFYAVSCTVNKKLCRAQDISGYPKIKLFAANAQGNATKNVLYWKLHVFDVLDALQIHVKHLPVVDTAAFDAITIGDSSSNSDETKRNGMETRTKKQVFDDAYLSFDFNMRNGIYIREGPLTNQTQAALKSWLTLVKKTIPVVWELHAVVSALLNNFRKVVIHEEHMLRILDQYHPPSRTWSPSCTKGVDGMGYTCGLWQLFHIISVGLMEYNLMITTNDDTVLSSLSISTTDAAETLRNFVEHFFACDVCRFNFLNDYDNCAHDRCHRLSSTEMNTDQWIQFPLWLFETHNAVNIRLQEERLAKQDDKEKTERINVEWPSRDACPACWLEHGGWDDEAVYKYLRTEYWSEDLISADYRAEVTKRIHDETIPTSGAYPQVIIQVIEWTVVVALLAMWYYNRSRHIRKGLHKKRDLDC